MYHVRDFLIPHRIRGGVSRCLALVGLASIALGLACNAATPATAPNPQDGATVPVVVTTTLLADLVSNIGGDRVAVTTLVPVGADVHSFRTAPGDSVAISRAEVIVSNGAGLDDFLKSVLASAQRAETVDVVASQGLEAVPLEEVMFVSNDPTGVANGGEAQTQESGPDHGENDPHFWMDPQLTMRYVAQIRDGLSQADPDHSATYAANTEAYLQELRDLDSEIESTLAVIPAQRRHLVTFHDAYGYFARRYGLELTAFTPSDASDVTPGAIVKVLDQIKSEGIPYVFVEPQFRSQVVAQAARDAGIGVATINALPNRDYPTYLEMMRANANSLADHLK